MRAKGHTSTTSGSGVDVGALARVAGTTYEMARRYAEGTSMPRGDKLKVIASWLGINASALAWGEAQGPATASAGAINREVLEECLRAVEEAQAALGAHLGAEQAASLVAVLYTEAMDGRMTSADGVRGLVRAMTISGRSSDNGRQS